MFPVARRAVRTARPSAGHILPADEIVQMVQIARSRYRTVTLIEAVLPPASTWIRHVPAAAPTT